MVCLFRASAPKLTGPSSGPEVRGGPGGSTYTELLRSPKWRGAGGCIGCRLALMYSRPLGSERLEPGGRLLLIKYSYPWGLFLCWPRTRPVFFVI